MKSTESKTHVSSFKTSRVIPTHLDQLIEMNFNKTHRSLLESCSIRYQSIVTTFKTSRTEHSHIVHPKMISFPSIHRHLSPVVVTLVVFSILSLLGQLAPTTRASTIHSSLFKRSTSDNEHQEQQKPHHQTALNYLLFSSKTRNQRNESNSKLDELLKDTNHSHISDRISLQLANSIWSDMHQNALEYAHERGESARPTINKLLGQANVSSQCSKSINDIIDRLEKLDDWAVRMYNSFGDFPANGFFEGTHTSMGDYHQCVNLEPNEWMGRAQYCTFKFQPILPKRPKYHNILAKIENLANTTRKDDVSISPLSVVASFDWTFR